MSNIQLFGDKGSTFLSLSNNIKLSLASKAAGGAIEVKISPDESALKLKEKSGFELTEPNAIVRYLLKDFNRNSFIMFEEKILYKYLRLNDRSGAESSLNKIPAKIGKAELNASQIILYASLYPFSMVDKFPSDLKEWSSQFEKLRGVQEAVEYARSITHLERPKEKNTGTRNIKTNFILEELKYPILPKEDKRNILVTSALPYVNNVPHLGNIIGSTLSADVYSRYAKARNYNTLFICGTDEYGTATETKALEENVTPQALCDKYHKLHKEIYDWFEIEFDHFGRTTTPLQTEIAQHIFLKLNENGYLEEKTMTQLYCEEHNAFLADRFVEGICPKCNYDDARGDQCDKCGVLLNPFELIEPRCKLDNSKPIPKDSTHIYLRLDQLEPEVEKWISVASEKGQWSKNSKSITNSWLRQGLEPRCITRDLIWGTPVPLEKYKHKVLYVWFDATIGYVSITANYLKDQDAKDWEKWWRQPEKVELRQFMGKDNVPFHTVVFPASQIGTREKWTMLHHINTTEYLQYEGGKFSKSRGVGVFGNNARDTGIPPSVWRYHLCSVRPETADSHFSWTEFVTKNNSELLANLGNFVNRLVKFLVAKYNGVVPQFSVTNLVNYDLFLSGINDLLKQYVETMEVGGLRHGLELAMFISARGNQFLQEHKLDNSLYTNHPDVSDAVVGVGVNLIYLLGALISPFMPSTTTQINEILNTAPLAIPDSFELAIEPGHCIGKPQYLFSRIDEKKIDEWKALFGGAKPT